MRTQLPLDTLYLRVITNAEFNAETECWEWLGPFDKDGYSHYRCRHFEPINVSSAHKLVYLIKKGEIPEGYTIDHLCRNVKCINPKHLEAVKHVVNIHRGDTGIRQREKTHCPQGHVYTASNIYWHKRKNGTYSRRCKECCNKRDTERYNKVRVGAK